MIKVGLKIWSINEAYVRPAQELLAEGVFDYLEVFVAPQTREADIDRWKAFGCPIVLHAPHSYAGLNMSLANCQEENWKLIDLVDRARTVLKARRVIFHPGIIGDPNETIRQFRRLKMDFPDLYKAIILENKPKIGEKEEICLGASPGEVRALREALGFPLCLDFAHAICYAVWAEKKWQEVLEEFLGMEPELFHLCDGFYEVKDRHEHLGAGEYDLNTIIRMIPDGAWVSLETKKDSRERLDDFKADAAFLKERVYVDH